MLLFHILRFRHGRDHLDAEVAGRRDHRRLASLEYRPEQNPDPARL